MNLVNMQRQVLPEHEENNLNALSMQLKDHKWIVLLVLWLMASTIQSKFVSDNDFFYYNPDMNFDTNMDSSNVNTFDDIDQGTFNMEQGAHNFYTLENNNIPSSMVLPPYMDSSLAADASTDCVEPEKGMADTNNSNNPAPADSATEKCADGEAPITTTAAPVEECTDNSSSKKAPLKFLMKTLLPSSSGSTATTTPAPDVNPPPDSSKNSATESTTAATTTTTTAATTAAPESAASKKTSDSASSSPVSAEADSKAKELHQIVQHLYIAQARVQLEASEIRRAQSVANTAQQHLEEAANRVRSIIGTLQAAQQEVASAAIRAQTAQLQLAAHDQLLFAARQDVDALSSQMVGLQAAEGFVQPKATFDVAGLLERLKKPLTDAEKPTAVPPIVPMPKIKTKRVAPTFPLGEYDESPYYD